MLGRPTHAVACSYRNEEKSVMASRGSSPSRVVCHACRLESRGDSSLARTRLILISILQQIMQRTPADFCFRHPPFLRCSLHRSAICFGIEDSYSRPSSPRARVQCALPFLQAARPGDVFEGRKVAFQGRSRLSRCKTSAGAVSNRVWMITRDPSNLDRLIRSDARRC